MASKAAIVNRLGLRKSRDNGQQASTLPATAINALA